MENMLLRMYAHSSDVHTSVHYVNKIAYKEMLDIHLSVSF